ncbi:MAG TPA: aminotransferase class IV [Gaiellaceae bacterium]|nr:aminotransferase class IV [Gaiellaceae bacterium]
MTLLAVAEAGRGVVPADAPVFYADDEGVLRGRAVFETIRVYGGRPFRLDAHLDRLALSAARLGLPPVERDALALAVAEALRAAGEPDAVLRLLWTPGREGERNPTGLALVSTLPQGHDEQRRHGIRLAVVPWAPGELTAGAKSTSYAENIAAQDDAGRRDAEDALFVGPDGVVLEAPTSNVWWREGRTLVTPSLELPILAGVTRAALLDLAAGLGYGVEEGRFPLERLLAADEAFLTSSVREVMPVVAVDGAAIGDGVPGPAATALQHALRAAAGYPGGA